MTTTLSPYATPKDVERFLLLERAIDSNGIPADHDVHRYIVQAAGEWEFRTKTAYRPVWEELEEHDMQATHPRHHELFGWQDFGIYKPFRLHHGPILPFDSTRGHRIDVYLGDDGTETTANPFGQWTNFVTDRTQGRQGGFWWVSPEGQTVWIQRSFFVRRNALVRFSYEWGKPIYTLSSSITSSDTTIAMNSVYRYQRRGYVRIGHEWIHHTGISGTSLTGCTRGEFGTTQEAHTSGDEVYEIPENVWRLIVMRAAQHYLENEQFVATTGEGSDAGRPMEKVNLWERRWEDAMRAYGPGMELI